MRRARAHRIAARLIAAGLACSVTLGAAAGEARVVLIVVDGLDAREVTDEVMPTLARAWRTARWCPGAESLAVMPARTNPNHATLATGVAPDVHGITGNAVFDQTTKTVRKLGTAADLETETIFTTAHRAGRGLRTAAAVGKPKLGLLFGGDGVRQLAPDVLWDGHAASDSARDEVTGYAYDGTTLAAARAFLEHDGVDFLFINLADVDRTSHGFGPRSPQAIETRRRTDAALSSFLDWLATEPGWPSTTVVITADHGFDAISHPLHVADLLRTHDLDGLAVVGDGGTGHVYLETTSTRSRDAARLAAVRRVVLADPGIAEALYLHPNPLDGDARHTTAAVHPEWHLVHERAGELLLIANPGYVVADGSTDEARLAGNHGGPAERRVPAVVIGAATGDPSVDCRGITAADLGRTVQSCFGLPEVQRLDGRPIAAEGRGRVLSGLCPPAPAASGGVTAP